MELPIPDAASVDGWLVRLEAIAAIVADMREHPSDATAAERACCSLDGAAADRLGQQAAVEACAPAAIVAAMLAHPSIAGVALWGCRALGSIAADHTAGQQAAVTAGAPAVVVAAIHSHMLFAEVALWCCRALERIAACFRPGQEDVVKAGALVAIVAAVRTHSSVVDVMQSGCSSLGCIIAGLAEGQQAAVDAGAPAAIVAAMSAHPCNCISEQGCRALASLVAFSPAGQQAAVTAGAPDIIVAAMVRADDVGSADCAALRQWGCLALSRIAQCVTVDDVGPSGPCLFDEAPVIEAVLSKFVDAMRSRLPTASLFHPAKGMPGDGRACDVALWVTVGCDADEQLARDCARICGLHPLPSFLRIATLPGGVAASGFSDRLCLEVQADVTGLSALRCAVGEIRRLLPFATIESRASPDVDTSAADSTVAGGGVPRVGPELPSLSPTGSSLTSRVVVPFNRGIVANAMVTYLLHRLREPRLDVSVWCAVETKLALPCLSDCVYVESPDIPPMNSRGILTGSNGDVYLSNVPRRDPIAGGPAAGGQHEVECTPGAWFGHGRAAYLLTSAHMLSLNSTQARSRRDPADAACEFFPFVGGVDPSFIDTRTRCFQVRDSMSSGATSTVADVAVFRAPSKYSAGTACLRGVDFLDLDSDGIVSYPPTGVIEMLTCSLPRGDGHFLVSGTARRWEGTTGYLKEHVLFLAQHVLGEDIEQGNSGSALRGVRGLHSFVHSRVLAASFQVCRAALIAGDDAVDALLVELARHPENVYLTFTPASCALAQAASILRVPLRELAYTSPPVALRTNCIVS